MPYFTRQVGASGGLIVNAAIGVSQARRNALTQAGQPVPNWVPVEALVDTGASCTCLDPIVLQQLGLSPTGSSLVNSPTTGMLPAIADQYDISIIILATKTSPPLIHHTIPVIQAVLFPTQGFHALIGRDILQACLLVYDGQSGTFSLGY